MMDSDKEQTIIDDKILLAEEVFSSTAYLKVNKELLKQFGPNLTVYITNLVDKMRYFRERGMLNEDGSFFLTLDMQVEQTGMSKYQLRKCKEKLIKEEILKTEMRGLPPKEFYKIDLGKLVDKYLFDLRTNIHQETERIRVKKLDEY